MASGCGAAAASLSVGVVLSVAIEMCTVMCDSGASWMGSGVVATRGVVMVKRRDHASGC